MSLYTPELVDGVWIIRKRCTVCERPLKLECGEQEPTGLTLKAAVLVSMCEDCADRDRAEQGRAEAERRMGERLRQSGLPRGMHGLRFGDMTQDTPARARAIVAAEHWASAGEVTAKGLMLWGEVGSGKTRLAGTAAWARLERFGLRWVSVAVLIAQLGSAFGDADRTVALKVLTGTTGLVLDDLDKVRAGEHVVSQLYAAIDRRVSAQAPLLITTNENPNALEERFGEAIASRIAGYCGPRVFHVEGPDRRMELGA